MKTIIAPADFSEASINAVNFAAGMALEIKADLILYHAIPDKATLVADMADEYEDTEIEEALANLNMLKDQLKKYAGDSLPVKTKLEYGNINGGLQKECRHNPPYAVVMSATQKTGVDRFLSGSETLSISRKLQVPLLLIPPFAKYKGFKKISLATDLKDVLDMPLEILTHWMQPFHPGLQLIYANSDNQLHVTNVSEAVALQTHFKEFYPTFQYIKNNNVREGIHKYCLENNTELLIIVAKKHSLFHKSISKEFVLHPDIPTLIVSQA